jgi:predicted nucleic acid-binding Zn ribbon protein
LTATIGTILLTIFILIDFAIAAPIGWCLWTALGRKLSPSDRAWRLVVFFLATLIFDFGIPVFAHQLIVDTGNDFVSMVLGFIIIGAVELAAYFLAWGALRVCETFKARTKTAHINLDALKYDSTGKPAGIPSQKKCAYCGKLLPPETDICSYCGRQISKIDLPCPRCGIATKPGTQVCNNCGAPLSMQRTKSKKTAVLLAVLFGFFAWLYIYRKSVWKFWLNLSLTLVTIGGWGLIGWVWAIIDTARRRASWYESYFESSPKTRTPPPEKDSTLTLDNRLVSSTKDRSTSSQSTASVYERVNIGQVNISVEALAGCIRNYDASDSVENTEQEPDSHISKMITESSYSASSKERWMFVWDIFILTFPLWCPGNASILRSEDVVDIFYDLGGRPRSLGKFLQAVMIYSARAMDRMFKRDGVEKINLWGAGRLRSPDPNQKDNWRILSLTLKRGSEQMEKTSYLSKLVAADPTKFLMICSARWTAENECSFWPPLGGNTGLYP